MINCPKCQVPNPDSATVCAACGTALVGQQFAQALDQAQQPPGEAPPAEAAQPAGAAQPAAPPQPAAPAQPEPAPQRQFDLGVPEEPAGLGVGGGTGMAQAEINQFMTEQAARKRTKAFIYGAVILVIGGVIGFFVLQSQRAKSREESVARFFEAFRKVDDGQVAEFWKCAVRAKDRDVRLASQATEVTDGLTKAFKNFPKSQPGRLLDKCIPMIPAIAEDLGKLEPPGGFAAPLDDYKNILKEVETTFTAYAKKIEQRKQTAMDEREIREAHSNFHQVIGNSGGFASVTDTPKAVAYFNILNCAIPDLVKAARKVKRAPDTQYVVEYIYNTCKKDPSFADKLRKECFAQRNSSTMRSPQFKAVARQMAGDDRDLYAIDDCFKRANHGFAFDELKAVAEVFGKYRNKGRKQIMDAVQKVKEELQQ
jgi:hypothetical protein